MHGKAEIKPFEPVAKPVVGAAFEIILAQGSCNHLTVWVSRHPTLLWATRAATTPVWPRALLR